MRQANASLLTFLNSRATCIKADLFTITLKNGTVYAWTSYDQDLRVGAYVYSALGPLIDRTKWGVKNTVDVPEMEVQIWSTGADMPDGSNLKLAVHNGLFDYANVRLSRVFMPTPGDVSLGAVDLFTGGVSDVKITAIGVTLTVKGANVQLDQYMPRNRFMLSCNHTLYDPGCAPNPGEAGGGPSRAAHTFPNTVGASPTRTAIAWGETPPPDYANFVRGYVTFTSGSCNGQARSINASSETGFTIVYPLYELPAPGDTYEVTHGCDRTKDGGCAFFDNKVHYRGFPWVPPANYAV
jgi:uncharacterized phage protein (TIGR02218 family)